MGDGDGGHFDHLKRDSRDQCIRESGIGASHVVTFMTHDTQERYTVRFVSQKDVILEVQSLLPEFGLCDRQSVAKDIVRLSKKAPETWGETIYARTRRPRPMVQAEAARIVAKALARIALADEGEIEEPSAASAPKKAKQQQGFPKLLTLSHIRSRRPRVF